MDRIAVILLTHQNPDAVRRMCDCWRRLAGDPALVVAHGGTAPACAAITGVPAVHVDDPQLRTRRHQRDRQSYLGVMKAALPLAADQGATHIYLAEYDEVPLARDLGTRLLNLMDEEDADVLGHRLWRVDGTNHAHYLNHSRDPAFHNYWRSLSVRGERDVVLSMLGCGTFWRIGAFAAVAALDPPLRIYLELCLPTAAHHLGYRVRPLAGQDDFMAPEIERFPADFAALRAAGAWRVHPVKHIWEQEVPDIFP